MSLNQPLSEQQTSQTGNETSDLLLTGSFVGAGDGQGIAKVILMAFIIFLG
jgi:hypothetical protein